MPKEDLELILQAGLSAPSSMNRQQVEMYVLSDKQMIDDLEAASKKHFGRGENEPCFYNPPHVVIVSGPGDYDALYSDGSSMLENIFVAATSMNVDSCWINWLHGHEDAPVIRAALSACGVPADHKVAGCAILGYSAEGDDAPRPKKAERIHYVG